MSSREKLWLLKTYLKSKIQDLSEWSRWSISPNTRWDPSPSSSRVPAQPPGIVWKLWNSLGNAVKHSAGPLWPRGSGMMSVGKLSSSRASRQPWRHNSFVASGNTWRERKLKGTARDFSWSIILIAFSGSLLKAFGSKDACLNVESGPEMRWKPSTCSHMEASFLRWGPVSCIGWQ